MKHITLQFFFACLVALTTCFQAIPSFAQNAPWPVLRLTDRTKASERLPAIIDNAGNNRGSCFDGQNIYVASRQNGNHVYYWTLGDTSSIPQEANLTGVTGGTFVLSDLASAGNQLFLCNMVFVGGSFKVYRWKDKSVAPDVLLEFPNAPARLGDAISVVGNPANQAKLIVSGHGTKDFYVWDIQADTILNAQPAVVNLDAITNANFGRINRVSSNPDQYLVSGPSTGLLLLDSAFQVVYQIPATFFPSWPMHAQIFNFSGKRYLTYVHVKSNPAENARYVLDITDGSTLDTAFQNLAQAAFLDRLVYQNSLGAVSNGNASVGTGLATDLYGNIICMSYAAGNGFLVEQYGDKKPASVDPVFTILDKTQESMKMPAIIDNAGNNRGSCFNGEHVFVASRQNGNHVYYWNPATPDDDPKELDLTGVSGGTFVLSDLTAAGKQIYLCNMVFVGGAFKVYRWADVTSQPELMLEFPSAPARLGDAFSIVGDPSEEARLIVSGHGSKSFYVWKINNGKIDNPTPDVVTFDEVTNVNFGRITQVQGEDGYYLASAPSFGLMLLNEAFEVKATLTGAFLPSWPMDAHVFQYKGQRLLGYTHVKSNPAQNALYILDLNDGENVEEAMKSIANSSHANKLIHQVSLGNISNGNASVSTDFVVEENGSVWAFSYAAGNGFLLQRFGEGTSNSQNYSIREGKVFPNPAREYLTVQYPNAIQTITITDMQGRLVKRFSGTESQVNCSLENIGSGFYIVTVMSQSRTETHPLIIVK